MRFISLVVVLLPLSHGAVSGGEMVNDSKTESQLARFYTAGMTDLLLSVRSGEFELTEAFRAKGGSVKTMRVCCAFDFAERRLRFDRYRGDHVNKFAETREGCLVYSSSGGVISKRLEARKCERSNVLPFDIRTIGLATLGEIRASFSLERVLEILDDAEVTEPVEVSDTVCKLSWVYTKSLKIRRSLWIDSSRGFAPIRMEVFVLGKEARPEAPEDWGRPVEGCETVWRENSGSWVPVQCKFEASGTERASFIFSWESINASVKPDLFEPEGFDLPKGTYVENKRLPDGRKVIEEVIGVAQYSHRPPAPRSRMGRFHLVVGANVLAALVGLAWFFWWKRRRRVA